MRKQPYPMAQLTQGLDVSIDPVFLADKASPELLNIRLHKGIVKKQLGWRQFSKSDAQGLPFMNSDEETPGTVMLIDSFPMSSGTTHALFITEEYIYLYDDTTDLYTIKNPLDGDDPDPLTGSPLDPICGCTGAGIILSTFYEVYIVANGIDPMLYWTGDVPTTSRFAILGATGAGWGAQSVTAKQVIMFKNRLIAGGTLETGTACPKRVRWTTAGSLTDITGTGSGFADLVDTDDWITCFVIMKDRLFVIKERSIWELEYVGGTTIFNPVIKVDGVGSYSPHGVISLDEEMIFYGSDNIYTFDGFSLKPLGGQLYPYLYEAKERIVNASLSAKFPSAYIEELKQYMLCVCTAERDIPDLLLRYDFDYDAWTREELEITAIGYFDILAGTPTWLELTGRWDEQTWTWLTRPLAPGAPTTLIGDSDGMVWEDDRLTTDTTYMKYVTKDFVFEHAVRWTDFRMQIKGGAFTVSYSLDGGVTWPASKAFGAQSDWTDFCWYLNFTAQKVRFKIESTATELEIRWLEPWFIPRQRSKVLVTS